MADITVRKMRFGFAEDLDLNVVRGNVKESCNWIALSLTMPYLEPYLIRTMREAVKEVSDPVLATDMKNFSAQESYHYGNHAKFNERVRAKVGETYAKKIQAIEDDLEADYERFTKEKSRAFNIAYAEGFEAMTSAMALTVCNDAYLAQQSDDWGKLIEWHLAEEIEHRNVAFDTFDYFVGSYPYRLSRGWYAQGHYLWYIFRFYKCLMQAQGHTVFVPSLPSFIVSSLPRYLKTLSPRYNPSHFGTTETMDKLLTKYSAIAESGGQI